MRVIGAERLAELEPQTPTLFARIRDAPALDWLPLEVDLELSSLIATSCGPEADRLRARTCLRTALDAPLLRPFVLGVETLFTLDPGGMLRQVPRGWPVLYRECGVMRYEIGGLGRRLLVHDRVPAILLDHPYYNAAIAGALESFFDLCKVEGEIEIERAGPARVHYHLSWW